MKTMTKEDQTNLSPQDAITLLKEGNQRFVNKSCINRDHLHQVTQTAEGQYPFATILSCIDSRAPAELIFDQGIGDVFNVRIAGNVVNEDILGSMEFACQLAGSKLILVLGHTNCGAVKGACDHAELSHLTGLLKKIEPAIGQEQNHSNNRDSSNLEFVNDVAKLNVSHSINEVLNQSEVIKNLVEQGNIKIVGAMYDITSGQVTFYE